MDKGKVVEVGDHETLLSKKGYYYRLYESQVGEIDKSKQITENDDTINNHIEEKEVSEIIEDGEVYEYN